MNGIGWTIERTETLVTLHAMGHSASRMAVEIGGVSRNSVLGKVHRLGLSSPRPPRPVSSLPRATRRYVRKVARAEIASPRLRPPTPVSTEATDLQIPIAQRRSFLELTAKTCRWPIGDGEGLFFCGAESLDGCPYCPSHTLRAYHPRVTRGISDHERDRRRMQALRNREAGVFR